MLVRNLVKVFKQSVRNSSKTAAAVTGLNYQLTDEQRRLQHELHSFAKDVVIPFAPHYDKTAAFPWYVIKEAHDAGILNANIPKEYGGHGFDLLSNVIVSEEIGYGCAAMATALLVNDFAETPLIIAASESIKKRFLGRMTEEPLVAAYAVSEPSAGSDIAGIRTTCVKKGDEYIINGSKMWVTNAGPASWFFVLCRSDPNPKTPISKAFTAFVVDGDMPGISKGTKQMTMGLRASDIRTVTFKDVHVPDDNVVGAPGEGFIVMMKTLEKTRAEVAAIATGLSSRCLDEATKYALERKTFGVPIAEHQAIATMLANMAINVELSRLITYRGAWEWMQGRPRGFFSSIAKCFCADAASAVTADAVDILGANGYNQKYPIEKLMRDAKVMRSFGGTCQIQRLVITRDLLKRVEETGTSIMAS